MKKAIAIVMACAVFTTVPVYADVDYSILEGMTLEDLEDLHEETEKRINALKSADSANAEDSIWTVMHYVDEFGRETDEGYVTTKMKIEGTFSNTATTDSLLYVTPLFEETVAFQLYEYGDQLVKGYLSKGDVFKIAILDPSGEKHVMEGILKDGSNRVLLYDKYVPEFYDILNENGKVAILLKDTEHSATEYYFQIDDSSHFSDAYLQIYDSVPHYQMGTEEEINVTMDVSVSYSVERSYPRYQKSIYVNIKTNLPDGTSLIIRGSAWNDDDVSDTVSVENGECSALLSYMSDSMLMSFISVKIKYNEKQPDELRTAYGDAYEKLVGDISDQMKSDSGYILRYNAQ